MACHKIADYKITIKYLQENKMSAFDDTEPSTEGIYRPYYLITEKDYI